MDENILKVFENAKSQINALREDALIKRKRHYRDAEASPLNVEIERKTEELITNLRAENEAAKAAQIARADQKAVDEIALEFSKADELIAKFLGGNR